MPNPTIPQQIMPGPFDKPHHICLVVRDLPAAVAYYESIGIGPWKDYPPLSGFTELSIDRQAFLSLTYKFTDLPGLQIQLCQPGDADTAQRRFLDTFGPGVYHLGFTVSDLERSEQDALGFGLQITARGRRDDHSGFTYFDTRSQAGVTLEIRASGVSGP
jgi:methylmalonyl-CoA/ethylmalonyl-CoA epimerase